MVWLPFLTGFWKTVGTLGFEIFYLSTLCFQVFFLFKRELERELVIESLGIFLATEIKTQGLFFSPYKKAAAGFGTVSQWLHSTGHRFWIQSSKMNSHSKDSFSDVNSFYQESGYFPRTLQQHPAFVWLIITVSAPAVRGCGQCTGGVCSGGRWGCEGRSRVLHVPSTSYICISINQSTVHFHHLRKFPLALFSQSVAPLTP